jgi:preprotein translocase subunit SecA
MNLSYVGRLKSQPFLKGLDAFANRVRGYLDNKLPRKSYYLFKARRLMKQAGKVAELTEEEMELEINDFKALAARGKLTGSSFKRAVAVVCEASFRSMKMHPYKVQVAAALSLQSGCIAEMATGEGKSLTAAVAAVLVGWRGRGCHVMTSNSYLACRDAEEFTPLFTLCGLSVAGIADDCEGEDRVAAYRADITYCTNQDVAADFLRDQLSMGSKQSSGRMLLNKFNDGKEVEPVLRGLEYAIIDEADSVMIDDGVTPLLISTESRKAEDEAMYQKAREICGKMTSLHYKLIENTIIELTPAGKKFIGTFEHCGAIWTMKRRREELLIQALKALHLFHKDKQYIIEEDKIIIVDQATGRTMPDRFWQNGMHQAVEAKEGVELSPAKETCARISFQRFFRLYRSIGGMTGTASEACDEFYSYYNLPVVKIPTHRKCLRKFIGHTVLTSEDKKWDKVALEVQKWHTKKRPILVGTANIKDSESLSERLTEMGVPHQVLNAKNNTEESDIVKNAGLSGKVTVATSMAGRGTDIKLSDSTKGNGGLLVITTQLYHSSRVDRQLQGRCSRQGDPGSVRCFYALDDEILKENMALVRYGLLSLTFLPGVFLLPFFRVAQWLSVKKSRKQRKSVLKGDDWLEDMLGFTGEGY